MNRTTIICDLDGVLADFVSAACLVHDRADYRVTRWNFFEDWGLTADEFWDAIHAHGDAFYGELVRPYPWCAELLETLCGAGNVIVMSSPSNHPCGYAAKKIWCDKYVPGVRLVVGSDKHLLAQPGRVLIDDYDKNIAAFHRCGGQVITFPQPWNAARDFSDARVEFVRASLDAITTRPHHRMRDEVITACPQPPASDFVVKDSGTRQTFASGMVRDTTAGKTDWHRAADGPMLRRWAEHLTKGNLKYPDVAPGVANWTQAAGTDELQRFRESAFRHFMQWYYGERDEDHAAAVFFNVNGYEFVQLRLTTPN